MIKYSKAVLYNTDLDTTQAFVFSEANHYLAILISGSGEDVFTKIRQVILDLQEQFFSMDQDIPERFETLYHNLQAKLTDLESSEVLLASWRTAEGAQSAKGTTDILYLQSWGDGRVYLKRKEEVIALITQSQNGQLISGYLQSGDRILMLSKTLDKILSTDSARLGYALSLPVTDLEEEIQLFLPEQGVMSPLAAILIDYQVEGEETVVSEAASSEIYPLQKTPNHVSPNKLRSGILKKQLGQIIAQLSKLPAAVSWLNPKQFSLRQPSAPQYLSSSINSKSRLFRVFNSKPKRIMLGIGIVLVILIVALVLRSHRNKQVSSAEFQSLMVLAKNDFTTADSLKDLNLDSAKQSLNKAEAEIAQAVQINPQDSQALALKQQIDSGKDGILKIYPISNWPLFLDLKLIKDNFSTEQLSYTSGQFLLLDPIQKTLVSVDASQKTNQILGGSIQLGDAQSAALSDTNALTYASDKGVLLTDIQNPKPLVVIKPAPQWGKIVDIAGFEGGVYLLDSEKNQIWKYVAVTSGYSDRVAYLQDGVKANFSDAQKMLIDSSIWVLKKSGEIDKFTSGAVDFFSPTGLDIPLKSVASFYVSPDTDNIYLLDTGNGRLVVLKKTGQYESQYTGDKFKDATDVAVDEKTKKIYLLENNSIYQIDLH